MLKLSIGDKLYWCASGFDTIKPQKELCKVTAIFKDHAIASTQDGLNLWIEEGLNDNDFIKA